MIAARDQLLVDAHQIALAHRVEREDLVAVRLGLLGALQQRRRGPAAGEHPFHFEAVPPDVKA